MSRRALVVGGFLCLLLASRSPAWGQALTLTFEFDVAFTPQPASFLVTSLRLTGPPAMTQFRLPNVGRASCAAVADGGLTAASQCGTTPDCLPPGLYSFWVQAEWGDATSPTSNLANCEAFPGCRYACDHVTLPPALLALLTPPADGGPLTVDEAALQAFVDSQVSVPTGDPVPSVTTPAPSVEDIVDAIGPALQALAQRPG